MNKGSAVRARTRRCGTGAPRRHSRTRCPAAGRPRPTTGAEKTGRHIGRQVRDRGIERGSPGAAAVGQRIAVDQHVTFPAGQMRATRAGRDAVQGRPVVPPPAIEVMGATGHQTRRGADMLAANSQYVLQIADLPVAPGDIKPAENTLVPRPLAATRLKIDNGPAPAFDSSALKMADTPLLWCRSSYERCGNHGSWSGRWL